MCVRIYTKNASFKAVTTLPSRITFNIYIYIAWTTGFPSEVGPKDFQVSVDMCTSIYKVCSITKQLPLHSRLFINE